jgi:sec-independent protein translocase protein TatA
MGLGGISPVQLLIIFGIVILIFGTAKLKNFGGDLGGAIKGFKKAMQGDDDDTDGEPKSKDSAKQIQADKEADAEFSEQAEKEKHS